MSNHTTTSNKPSAVYNLPKKGVLLISTELAAQITALHKACGKREWSGVLLYRVISEDIANPDNFRARAEGIYPMNVGSPGYTEYEHDEDTLDMFDHYPKADPENNKNPLKLGQIHTHHGMSAFFSGTDTDELKDNAGKYNYYLSLIVNFDGDYCAKIAFEAETEKKVSYKSKNKWRNLTSPKEKVLVTFDLEVKIDMPTWFTDRVRTLERPSYHRPTHQPSYSPPIQGFRQNQSSAPAGLNSTNSLVTMALKERIRTVVPSLLIPEKHGKAETKFFWVFDEMSKIYKTPKEMKEYTDGVLARIDNWLDKNFSEEIVRSNGYDEEKIVRTIHDLVDTYQTGNMLAAATAGALKGYIDVMYEATPSNRKKETDVTDPATFQNLSSEYHGYDPSECD